MVFSSCAVYKVISSHGRKTECVDRVWSTPLSNKIKIFMVLVAVDQLSTWQNLFISCSPSELCEHRSSVEYFGDPT